MAITQQEIEDLAKAPDLTRTDEGVVKERPIDELIKADQYSTAKQASAVPWGMRIARTRPGGTV